MNLLTGGTLGIVGVALAHGIALMAMVYALGHISGSHANPAVTIGLWSAGKIKSKEAILYIISQLIGAAVAGGLISVIFTPFVPSIANLGALTINQAITTTNAAIIEAVLTFFLVFTVMGVTDPRNKVDNPGIPIGLVLAGGILVGGVLTGGALNPARAFGPALAAGFWTDQWVYWIGPIVGGLIAALLYKFGLMKKISVEQKKKR